MRARGGDPHARERGAGRIICIGSPTGQRGNFGQTNYAAAKAGIVGMVRTWALELKRAGITANAVIPVAATAMTATVPYFAAAVEADAAGEPMPAFFRHDLGFGTSDDVAGLIAYLASDAAAGVTGQAIGVGGDRMQLWSHPEPVVTAYREGGWSYEALVEESSAADRRRAAVGRRDVPAAARGAAAPAPTPDARRTAMTRYEPAIDLDAIDAIDVHVHIEVDGHGHASLPPDLVEAASAYFSADGPRPDLDSVAAYYRERRMAAVVFTVDASTRLGHPPLSSAEIAEGAARNNDVLIPFGSVDPHRARTRVDRVRRLVEEHGVRGFKFHPTVQGFDPSDEQLRIRCTPRSRSRRVGALPHRPDRHRRRDARRLRPPARTVEPDAARPGRRRLPRPADHHGPPVGAVAGRGPLGRDPQAQHLDRPVRLEPEVLPRRARPRTRTRS